jgi:signal transduction histidine kinase
MPQQEHKKRGKLRDTFIVLFVLIACIPILALGTIALNNITKSYKKNISEREHQTLIQASDVVSLFFNSAIETLSTNFDTLESSSLDASTTAISWQQTYAKKFVEDNDAFLEVSFINLQGKEVAKYSKINSSKNLLYFSELPLFKKALAGEVAIGSIHTTEHGQAITLAVPSLVNGKVFNVVMAEVTLKPLSKLLDTIHLGDTGYVLLFDDSGRLLTSKITGDTLHKSFSFWERLSHVFRTQNNNGLSLEDRYQSLITSVPVVSSALRIPDINWALFVEWPIKESDIVIENFRNTVLITVIISIIIVIFIAILIANRLVLPIRLLQVASQEIEKGNFEKQIVVTTNDELEELAESFTSMTGGLKRLEELKNEFVYVAAHELRAPVTAIKGYIELIFDGSAGAITPQMEHLLSPIKKSNERLVNLVNDLLQVARSEAGKLEIVLTPSDIKKEVVAILEEIHPLAQKRNITVIYHSEQNLPLVNLNTGNFKEVIMNFASNAVKYGKDNGQMIIAHEIRDGMVTTSITDDGRGMSEEDQKHLFEKFFRAGDVRKTSIEGTGLGLFITKELVEKMGGTLSVTSTLGVGTTFTVAFKIAEINITSTTES